MLLDAAGNAKVADFGTVREGAKKGKCSDKNWIDRTSECTSSCIHASLYWFAAHDKKYISGPDARAAKALAESKGESKGEGDWAPPPSEQQQVLHCASNPDPNP